MKYHWTIQENQNYVRNWNVLCFMNEKYCVVDIVNKHGGIANKQSNTG
jgi:hypothetical protein